MYILEKPAYDFLPHFVFLEISLERGEQHLKVLTDEEQQPLLNEWGPVPRELLIGHRISEAILVDYLVRNLLNINLLIISHCRSLLEHLLVGLLLLLLFGEVEYDWKHLLHDFVNADLRFEPAHDSLLHQAEDHQVHFQDVLFAGEIETEFGKQILDVLLAVLVLTHALAYEIEAKFEDE